MVAQAIQTCEFCKIPIPIPVLKIPILLSFQKKSHRNKNFLFQGVTTTFIK